MKTGYANFSKALLLWIRRYFTVFGCLVLSLAVIGALLNTDNILFCTQILWLALFSSLVACTFTVTDFLAKKQVGTVILRAVHFALSYLSFLATFVWRRRGIVSEKQHGLNQPHFYGGVYVVFVYRRVCCCQRGAAWLFCFDRPPEAVGKRVSKAVCRYGGQ